jgi:hypothetical protein
MIDKPAAKQLKVVLWQPPSNLTHRRMSLNIGRTIDEGHAFDFCRAQVAENLGGVFNSSFWSQDVLRVAEEKQSVRHALVAVTALSESRPKRTPEPESLVSSISSKTFIIQQHNKVCRS